MTNGLFKKSGLILLNKDTYCAIVYPHDSDISMKNRIHALRCAKAVMACISIVFLSSKEWSKIPGESITYHLT
jgi:hypothetical protein